MNIGEYVCACKVVLFRATETFRLFLQFAFKYRSRIYLRSFFCEFQRIYTLNDTYKMSICFQTTRNRFAHDSWNPPVCFRTTPLTLYKETPSKAAFWGKNTHLFTLYSIQKMRKLIRYLKRSDLTEHFYLCLDWKKNINFSENSG